MPGAVLTPHLPSLHLSLNFQKVKDTHCYYCNGNFSAFQSIYIQARPKMASLADELLNDFEDDGDANDEQENGFHDENEAHDADGLRASPDLGRDGDEEEMEDADEDVAASESTAVETADDEDETKARVEKMRLGGVRDVRSVAGLMKTLEPVLEVSSLPFLSLEALFVYTAWIQP